MAGYLSRQVLILALLIPLCSVFLPDDARAQTTCSAANGNDGFDTFVARIRAATAGAVGCSNGNTAFSTYVFPGTTNSDFSLWLPGDEPATGDTNPVKVAAENTADANLSVTAISCPGGTVGGVGTVAGTVTLPDGGSCQLYVFWENGANDISFSGATLSRTGDIYAIDGNGVIAGEDFGGAAVQPNPEIDIQRPASTSIADGGTDAQGAQTAGTAVTTTYTVANLGGATLNVTNITSAAASNVTVNTISTTSISVASLSTATFDVTYTPSAAGAFSFDLDIVSDDADEANYDITVSGTAAAPPATTGTITIVKTTAPVAAGDGTFTFVSSNAGLNGLSIATASNTGSSSAVTVNTGGITVTENEISGWRLRSIVCSGDLDNGSVVDVASRTVTIDLDASENIICTFTNERDPNAVIQRTQRIISNFMSRRADQITANEPDLTNRLGNRGGGSNGGPVTFTGHGTAQNNNLAFATGLRQIVRSNEVRKRQRQRELGHLMALGTRNAGGSTLPTSGFDIWVKGTWSSIDNDTAETDLGLLYVGADYRFSSNLVIGLLAQFDWADEEDDTNNFKIDGRGWLAGPYVVARLHKNLIFDGRAAWGRSDNDVSPFNTFTDSFDGERWLVKGQLTGDFRFGAVHLAPHVGVIYFEEQQKAYTDSLGNTIGKQTVELGRVTFGPKISTTYKNKDGTTIAPFVAVKGIWDFKRTDQVDIATGIAVTGNDKLRGRAEAGLSLRLPDGISLTGEGFFDGIGAEDFDAYGGSITVTVPF